MLTNARMHVRSTYAGQRICSSPHDHAYQCMCALRMRGNAFAMQADNNKTAVICLNEKCGSTTWKHAFMNGIQGTGTSDSPSLPTVLLKLVWCIHCIVQVCVLCGNQVWYVYCVKTEGYIQFWFRISYFKQVGGWCPISIAMAAMFDK